VRSHFVNLRHQQAHTTWRRRLPGRRAPLPPPSPLMPTPASPDPRRAHTGRTTPRGLGFRGLVILRRGDGRVWLSTLLRRLQLPPAAAAARRDNTTRPPRRRRTSNTPRSPRAVVPAVLSQPPSGAHPCTSLPGFCLIQYGFEDASFYQNNAAARAIQAYSDVRSDASCLRTFPVFYAAAPLLLAARNLSCA